MLDSISYEQFIEWQRYYAVEPWGEARGDLRIAILCSLVANMFRDKKSDPITPDAFMPYKDAGEEDRPKRGATIAPETVSWLYAMAAKNDIAKANNGN